MKLTAIDREAKTATVKFNGQTRILSFRYGHDENVIYVPIAGRVGATGIKLCRFKNTAMNHCDRPCHKHGKDTAGYQRWLCPVCRKTFSENPAPKKPGCKPKDSIRAMTDVEKQRAKRARDKGTKE